MQAISKVLLVLLFVCPVLQAQNQGDRVAHPNEDVENRSRKAQADERARKIKRDSARLLEIATELKHYVDRTDGNVMSLEVIKKAEQMEKLARDLKNQMKGE